MVDIAVPTIATVTPASGDTVLGVQGGAVKRMAVGGVGLAGLGAAQTFTAEQAFMDAAAATTHCIEVDHYGDGTGGVSAVYGIDLQNHTGAKTALVIHQYSRAGEAALVIDNTDSGVGVLMRNTHNVTLNPGGAALGTSATGEFIRLAGTDGTSWLRIFGRGEVLMNPPADAVTHALEIIGAAGSNKRLFRATMNGPGTAVEIAAAAGSAGFLPFLVTGYDYGPRFTTSQNNGRALEVNKNATGVGEAVRVTNSGTGNSLAIRSASAEVFTITAAGLPQWSAAANQQTTVGAAGAAAALPATPAKYLKVVDSAGTTYVVPCYAAA